MALSTRLTDLRTTSKKSLKDVADAVGVTKSYIWELEKGKSKNPSADLIKRLAELFAVPVEYLLDPEKSELSDSDDALVFYRDLKSLSEADQQYVKDSIKLLRERAKKSNGTQS